LIRYASTLVDVYATYSLSRVTITADDFTYHPRYDRRHSLNLFAVVHPLENLDVAFRWEVGSGFPFTQTIGYYDREALTQVFREPYVGLTGIPYTILGAKNAARLPTYHRLDASAGYRFTFGRLKGQLGVHIVNVYDHSNLFYFDRKTGRQINMLRFFPTATLNLEY